MEGWMYGLGERRVAAFRAEAKSKTQSAIDYWSSYHLQSPPSSLLLQQRLLHQLQLQQPLSRQPPNSSQIIPFLPHPPAAAAAAAAAAGPAPAGETPRRPPPAWRPSCRT